MQGLSLLFALIAEPGLAIGRTWRVEKDGSGDTSVIQDAVEAAASGDTIRIGPGRFSEYTTHVYANNEWNTYVHVRLEELTIIGSGQEATIIGADVPGTWATWDYAPAIFFWPPNVNGVLQVRDLMLADVVHGIYGETGSIIVSNVAFDSLTQGLWTHAEVDVSSCGFRDISDTGVLGFGPSGGISIRNCTFLRNYAPFNCQSLQSLIVEDCTMHDCVNSGVFDRCAGALRRCRFDGTIVGGMGIFGTGTIEIVDNRFLGGYTNIYFDGASNVLCRGNVFAGSTLSAISITTCTPRILGNDILKGPGWAVRLGGFSMTSDLHVDMTNNYWGTADADSISAWIKDGYDQWPGPMHGFVDFQPFSSTTVDNEKESLGSIKAMFR